MWWVIKTKNDEVFYINPARVDYVEFRPPTEEAGVTMRIQFEPRSLVFGGLSDREVADMWITPAVEDVEEEFRVLRGEYNWERKP